MTTTTATSQASPERTSDRPRRARLLARRGLVLAAALALVAAACGGDDGDTATAGAGDESSGGESGGGGGGDLSIDLVSPADGDEVEVPFDVEVDPSVDIGEPDTGLHHVHLYYDGETAEGDYDLVYQPTFTVERDLDEGEHAIEAVIANADHSLTDARTEITVTVGAGGTGGGTDATDSGGYDY
jgi:hypothetical protein